MDEMYTPWFGQRIVFFARAGSACMAPFRSLVFAIVNESLLVLLST